MRLRQEAHEFEASLGKVNKTLSKNKNTNKRAEGLTQVVECLPRMQEFLGFILKQISNKQQKTLKMN
jgi:hypothetical protein